MWDDHPYNADRGGPCRRQLDLLTAPRRHGGGEAADRLRRRALGRLGAVFAWDLWNELGHDHGVASEAIGPDLAGQTLDRRSSPSSRRHVREIERRLFGRTHLQTVSHFGAEPAGRWPT